jgi:hypothetical protein
MHVYSNDNDVLPCIKIVLQARPSVGLGKKFLYGGRLGIREVSDFSGHVLQGTVIRKQSTGDISGCSYYEAIKLDKKPTWIAATDRTISNQSYGHEWSGGIPSAALSFGKSPPSRQAPSPPKSQSTATVNIWFSSSFRPRRTMSVSPPPDSLHRLSSPPAPSPPPHPISNRGAPLDPARQPLPPVRRGGPSSRRRGSALPGRWRAHPGV